MRKLAAILFVDIVGYTSLMGESEEKAMSAIRSLNGIAKPTIANVGGKWHKDLGDGFLFSFDSALDAVKSAIAIQQKINTGETFRTRIGIHMGDVQFEGEDIIGDGVNIASRIQGEAAIGGIAISETVKQSIRNHKEIQWVKIRKKILKNVDEDILLFQIIAPGVEYKIKNKKAINPFLILSAGILIGVILTYWVLNKWQMEESEKPVRRYSITLPPEAPLELIGNAPFGAGQRAFDITHNGNKIVYVAKTDKGPMLAIRALSSYNTDILPGTEGAYFPFFSPDGEWIGFFNDRYLMKINTSGNGIEKLVDISLPKGGVWLENENIIIADNDGGTIKKISTTPNNNRGLVEVIEQGSMLYWPADLPVHHSILLSSGSGIHMYNIETNEKNRILNEGSTPYYLDPGYLVYTNNGRIKTVILDPETYQVDGSKTYFLDNVRTETVRAGSQYTLSDEGSLIYIEGEAANMGELVMVNRMGKEIETISLEAGNFGQMALSPDGSNLLYTISGINSGLYLYDMEKKRSTLLHKRPSMHAWCPDGRSFTFVSWNKNGGALVRQSIDDMRTDTLVSDRKSMIGPYGWSEDGRFLIYVEYHKETLRDLMILDCSQDNPMPQVLLNSPAQEMFADFSSNGDYFVYESKDPSGDGGIYVSSFPPNEGKVKIADDGMEPFWVNDGKEIVYMSSDFRVMYSVPIDWSNGIRPGVPEVLWESAYIDVPGRSYAIPKKGDFFVFKKSILQSVTRDHILVVENWLEEVKEALK